MTQLTQTVSPPDTTPIKFSESHRVDTLDSNSLHAVVVLGAPMSRFLINS